MNNNDIIIKLCAALRMDTETLVTVIEKGGKTITLAEAADLISCTKDYRQSTHADLVGVCSDELLETFFNGLIIHKRGPKESSDSKGNNPVLKILDRRNVNNIMLKKVKIALEMTNEDMVMIFEEVNFEVSKGKLTTFFRKEDHKHYKRCNDKYAEAFLQGLTILNQ